MRQPWPAMAAMVHNAADGGAVTWYRLMLPMNNSKQCCQCNEAVQCSNDAAMESQWSYNGANGLSMPDGTNVMEPMVHIFNKLMPGTLNGAQWGFVPPLRCELQSLQAAITCELQLLQLYALI